MPYFSSFPVISYANTQVTDLTRRAVIPPSVLRQPTAFFPYTVEGSQRQDTVSFLYYQEEDDDWLISLANQIVDPYYGWYMDYDQLVAFVTDKYGSFPEAATRIDHWQSNWASDTRSVPTGYFKALTPNLQKYWIPNFGQGLTITGYSRRQSDWVTETNQLMDFIPSSPVAWEVGDLVTSYDPLGNRQGTGELVWVTPTRCRIKNVQGFWLPGYTVTDGTLSTTTTTVDPPVMIIPIDEIPYFEPVTSWDVEFDKNEENKEVLLIQDAYRGTMYSALTQALLSQTNG